MLVTRVSRSAILLGRIAADAFRMVVQSINILALAYVLGAWPTTGILGVLLILLTVSLFGLSWAGISLSLGLKTKNAESVFGIGGFVTFPLLFISTALTPLSFMPDWMQVVSQFNPISYTVDALRVIFLTGFDWTTILTAYAVFGVLGFATLGATVYQFKKIVG
jgi:ABC-2 type transport system permease protein